MRLPTFLTRSKIIILVAVVVIGIGSFFYFNRTKSSPYETIVVGRGTLTQEVTVTGNVTPVKSAALAFEKGGKIKGIYVDVGQRVVAGQTLAETDNDDLRAGVLDAQANLDAEQAKLGELKRGTRPEEIQISETKVTSARISLTDAAQTMRDKISDAYTKSDDAVRNQADQLFSNPRGSTPQFNFTLSDSQLKINIEQGRFAAEKMFVSWQNDVINLPLSQDLTASIALTKKNLISVKALIDNIALAVNSFTPTGTLSQTTIDGYKADISTARTNINTAIVNITGVDQSLRDAQSALTLAENNLTLDQAGATQETIAAQQARVEQADAKVQTAKAMLDKTILRSPIAGIITKKDAKVGEIISGNESVLSVITDQNLEIDVNVPETDIAKVNVGDTATITLDAYGESVFFEATVGSIDPAATIIEGVPTYKTTLYFTKYDTRIKSGMTANIDILTNKRENALSIPTRAIMVNNGSATVDVENPDKTIRTTTVILGIKSSDGKTEIVDGLKEGDRVILNTKK